MTPIVPSLTWKQILQLQPCDGERDAARRKLKALLPDYAKRELTLADAAAAGIDFDGLVWIASRAAEQSPDCARRIRLFAADCAARVSHIANDPRSTEAIIATRAFARGEITFVARGVAWDAAWDAVRAASWDAVRAAGWDPARAAARAAAWDAVRAAAWDAARAAAWDAAMAAVWYAEKSWQRDRLVAWFSENEPEDWPINISHSK